MVSFGTNPVIVSFDNQFGSTPIFRISGAQRRQFERLSAGHELYLVNDSSFERVTQDMFQLWTAPFDYHFRDSSIEWRKNMSDFARTLLGEDEDRWNAMARHWESIEPIHARLGLYAAGGSP